jgi:hypothetical protein
MSRWFRFYDEALNDPKILKLPDDLFRIWVGLLCVASKNEGNFPPISVVALLIRLKPKKAQEAIEKLITAGLIDTGEGDSHPHNWSGRQYKSDVSTERVKRFRNGKVTPPDTDTDTDTDTEKKKDIGTVAKATRPAFDQKFNEFWKAYPSRGKASNPRKPARELFEKHLKNGIDPDEIIAGARKGIGTNSDKAGTEFVPQAVKWLRDERWRDSASSSDELLSAQERDQLFAKLREKANDQSGERTELRETGIGSREVQREGREGSAGPPDNRTRNAGMVSVAAVFRQPSGFRADSHEAGSNGDEPENDCARAMAARF